MTLYGVVGAAPFSVIMGKSRARRFKAAGYAPTPAVKQAAEPEDPAEGESLHAEDLLQKVSELYPSPAWVSCPHSTESMCVRRGPLSERGCYVCPSQDHIHVLDDLLQIATLTTRNNNTCDCSVIAD